MAYNAEEIGAVSLVLRSARAGDRIAPLGMGGRSRLVRDLLREAKVPSEKRDGAPVIARADTGEILWIVGIAQAESTRVADDARERVVRLRAEWIFQE
jgi:tRNA(Ile)-lysidine synthetase-like protein